MPTDDDATRYGPIRLLPESVDRPIRPDLPWLRNLSWVKIHSLQLGLGFALFAYFAVAWGEVGALIGASVVVIEVVFGKADGATHDLGVHDVVEKPWYFLSAFVVTVGVFVVAIGPP